MGGRSEMLTCIAFFAILTDIVGHMWPVKLLSAYILSMCQAEMAMYIMIFSLSYLSKILWYVQFFLYIMKSLRSFFNTF